MRPNCVRSFSSGTSSLQPMAAGGAQGAPFAPRALSTIEKKPLSEKISAAAMTLSPVRLDSASTVRGPALASGLRSRSTATRPFPSDIADTASWLCPPLTRIVTSSLASKPAAVTRVLSSRRFENGFAMKAAVRAKPVCAVAPEEPAASIARLIPAVS